MHQQICIWSVVNDDQGKGMEKQQTEEREGVLQNKSGDRFSFSCSDYVEIHIILSDSSLIT
jgi:hypothetical protein